MRVLRLLVPLLLLVGLIAAPLGPARADDEPSAPPLPVESAQAVADQITESTKDAAEESRPTAREALAEARQLLAPKRQDVSKQEKARRLLAGKQTTLALRDLVLNRSALTPAEQQNAKSFYSRPYVQRPGCDAEGAATCVHATKHAKRDASGRIVGYTNVPATQQQLDLTRDVAERVASRYAAAGYKRPLSDGTRGGNAKLDVYLDDLGDQGLYGYCSLSEKPDPGVYVAPAFCVLDNDYASSQYPYNTARQNLEVTMAHEYFHAVQYAYDAAEDLWFMEGSAAWAEDELFDSINDNRQYLDYSQLTHPRTPLDKQVQYFEYGAWLFFRFITERVSKEQGGLPEVMLAMWKQADSTGAYGPDRYSVQAVAGALHYRGHDFYDFYGKFAEANRRPWSTYSEGRALRYPKASPIRTHRLGAKQGAADDFTVHHLSSGTVRLIPSRLSARGWRIRVHGNLTRKAIGTRAWLTIVYKNGSTARKQVKLNSDGDGTTTAPFSSTTVQYLDLTLINGNRSFRCGDNPAAYSCQGTPYYDGKVQKYSVRVYH